MILHSLKMKHKAFLREQGFNPKAWLLVSETADNYRFYNRAVKKIMDIRY